MSLTLAQDPTAVDPTKPNPAGQLTLAQPQTPKAQVPGQAGGQPQLTMAQPAIPAPTVAAPNAPVDRLSLAQSNFDTAAAKSAPAYQASIDAATRAAAGAGQIGSGQLRTTYGDLSLARSRDLDTLRQENVNKATEGSIADATTAYQQQLAAAQQAEANRLGEGNLTLAGRAQDTSELGVKGNLDIAKGGLDLATTGQAADIANKKGALALAEKTQATGADQAQQQIDLAKKTADINAAYQAGTLTLAQKNQALQELTAKNQDANAKTQLALAATGQTMQDKQAAAALAEQTAARLQAGSQFDASLAQSGEQFKQSLAQNAQQFGLSQDQQMALAKLNDATANRSIDVTKEQGKKQLLVQLAAILGGPTGKDNIDALQAIAQKFGVIIPGKNGGGGGGGDGDGDGDGDTDGGTGGR